VYRPHFDRPPGFWARALLVCAALSCIGSPAFAWLEQVVVGHETKLDLEPSGWVEARHQLIISLRGGPLKSLEIEGIGEDIELLADAKVTRVTSSNAPGTPLRLGLTEGGALRLEVLGLDGLRSGTYRFDFAYRLDAKKKKLLAPEGDRVVFTWVGPRLRGGVDSAKVTVLVPHSATPPSLPQSPERGARGVLLGHVLSGSGKDEIELLRAHVAVGEPAVWQVEFERAVAPAALPADPQAPLGLASGPRLLQHPPASLWQWGLAATLALGVGYLLLRKEAAVSILARRTDSRARPLVPGPGWLKALLAMGAAGAFVTWTILHRTGLAMSAGLVMTVLCVHFPPVRRNSPRGPGTWVPLGVDAPPRPSWPLAVRCFDSSTLPGFALAAGLLFLGAGVAYVRLPHDNLQALMSILLVLLLSPLFLTGRLSDFPRSPVEQALPWLRLLESARLGLVRKLELWGRQTELGGAGTSVDEVRLRIVLEQPPSGLRALEVAFEEGPGTYVSPCLVIRVVEDSAAHERLPNAIVWSRGRASEEKTTILHPAAPTRGQLLRLLRSVLAYLVHQPVPPANRDQKVDRSSGKADSARNRNRPLSAAM
jgi:hypothetical protein